MRRFVEPLLLAAAWLVCYWFDRSPGVLAATPFVQQGVWRQLLYVYGLMFALLTIVSLLLAAKGRALAGAVRDEWRAEARRFSMLGRVFRMDRYSVWFMLAILGIAMYVRVAFLWQPMRYDESASLLDYVHGGLANAFYYLVPNNHVMNTLLEKVACFLFGPTPLAVRLPALMAGVLLVPATFVVSRKMNQGQGGFGAALCVAVAPFLVFYATNGRGYSLLSLLSVLVIGASLADNGRQVSGRWGLAALFSAMGMLVMPSMLFPVASVCAWVAACLAVETRDWRCVSGYLLAYGAATVIMTLLLYTPVVLVSGGFGLLISNKYVIALPMNRFAGDVMPHVLQTVGDFSRDVPFVLLALVLMACALGIVISFRAGRYASSLLFPMFLVGAVALFFIKRSIPFSRTWIYFIPVLAISADAGGWFFVAKLKLPMRTMVAAASLVGAGWLAFHLVGSDAISKYPDTGSFRDARAVADYLAPLISRGDGICAQAPGDLTTAYYLWRDLAPADYMSRPVTHRKFFLQILPAVKTLDVGQNWRLLSAGGGYALYEWSVPTEAIARATCWSPFELAIR